MIHDRSAREEPHFCHLRRIPTGEARAFIRESWTVQAAQCRTAVERALPDSCIEIYINLDRAARQPFEGRRRGTLQPRAAWVIGPHAVPLLMEKEVADCDVVGARLELGTATAILGVPAREVCSALIDLDLLWGSSVETLRQRLAERSDPLERIAVVEETLVDRARRRACATDVELAATMAAALGAGHCTTIAQLARAHGLTHRRTIDVLDRATGLKPKALQRVQRLRRVLHAVHEVNRPPWTQVAHDCGYYDQAHFINDFRALAGISPAEYDARRSSVGRGFARHLGANEG
jgi:AraC-like DNA-binding protein